MIYDLEKVYYNGYIIPMEFWKPVTQEMVPGIRPIYWISNIGNLYNSETGYYSNATIHPNDYIRIMVQMQDGTRQMTTIHRLVCLAFNGIPEDFAYEVDHINCDKTCSVENNLEWVTKYENNMRARNNKLIPVAEDHYRSILTNDEVHEICNMLQNHIPIDEICNIIDNKILPRKFACGIKSIIYQLLSKSIWKEITLNYNFPSYSRIHFTDEEVHIACQMMQDGCIYDDVINKLRPNCDSHERERLKEVLYHIRRGAFFKEISSQYNLSVRKANHLTNEEVDIVCNNIARGISFKETISELPRTSNPRIKEAVYSIYRGKTKKDRVAYFKNLIEEGSTTIP